MKYSSLQSIRYHIEIPVKSFKKARGSVIVLGWCVDIKNVKAGAIRTRIGKRVYEVLFGPKPEVSMAFSEECKLPIDVGFVCVLPVPLGFHVIHVEILRSDGLWVSVRRFLLVNIPLLFGGVGKPVVEAFQKDKLSNVISTGFTFHQTIAVAYLVRGNDIDWEKSCERFVESYKNISAGVEHSLYILFKGFSTEDDLLKAKELCSPVTFEAVYLDDDSFDIGAYIEWANIVEEEYICVFNTTSEILSNDWLLKLARNLMQANVGMVGATGSYESLRVLYRDFPLFPNVHIRSNAFMIDRNYFCGLSLGLEINCKKDAFHFESGHNSLTNKVLSKGKEVLLVGGNGQGYSPPSWPSSGTFRQGKQDNLLIADNQTKAYDKLPWENKKAKIFSTWGMEYVRKGESL